MAAAALAPDSRHAYSGGDDRIVRLSDTEQGRELRSPAGHTGPVLAVALAAGAGHVLSGGSDGSARWWGYEGDGWTQHRFDGPDREVVAVAVSPDGRHLLAAGQDQSFRLWSAGTLQVEANNKMPSSFPISQLEFVGDNRRVVVVGSVAYPQLYDVQTGAIVSQFQSVHISGPLCTAVPPDGKTLLTGGQDRLLVLWDLATGKELRRLIGHLDPVLAVTFQPDGQHALSVGADKTLWQWDLKGKAHQVVKELDWDLPPPLQAAFAPGGKLLALAGGNGRVMLWETQSGTKLAEWTLPGPVQRLAVSPDGGCLATANANGTVYVYRVNVP